MSETLVKPTTLPGFMELLPHQQILFNHMTDTIRKNYEKFGFLPIDTPIIEKSEVLLAKGGGETEKQIYKVVKGSADMSLRFDLTVPLARYVAQHYSDLSFPFKRYHIGKVYRGERHQRGRFREFYQCDVDIIGNGSLDVVNDAEIPAIIYSTFKDLGFDSFTIRINNRKVITGFLQSLEIEDSTLVLRAIDKLEKIGIDKVKGELIDLGIGEEKVEKIVTFINIKGSNEFTIEELKKLSIDNSLFQEGLEELETVSNYILSFGVDKDNYKIDLTITRGLDYYTGTVYETFLDNHPEIGSVCSGGRYDDLANHYTKQKLPGVGISIGLTRLYYQLTEGKIIDTEEKSLAKVLIIPLDENYLQKSVEIGNQLRNQDIFTQVYLEPARLGRKFNYADRTKFPYVIVVGEEEVKTGLYSLRDMKSGQQENLSIEELIESLK